MASENVRGCGYRKVGGMYLVSSDLWIGCDRLPYHLESCPVCGAGIHFTRSMTEVDPLQLFGEHAPSLCFDKVRPCKMCDPTSEPAFIKTIGKKYYSTISYLEEARMMGLSLRIAQIPRHLKLGETVVYLAHPEAVYTEATPEEQEKTGKFASPRLGIFAAFMPTAIEMPVWESQLKGKGSRKFKDALKKRGITPVVVKGREHDPKYKPRK